MIETYCRLILHDREGKIVKDTGKLPSHSYVIQFMEMLWGFFDREEKLATMTNGAEGYICTFTYIDLKNRVDALATDATHGIVVGTNAGSSPEDNEDYSLDSKITHGIGAGQLNYQAVTMIAPRVVGANIDLDISRTFLNESGSTITVKEIGIILKTYDHPVYYHHLILRDVVSDEPVLDGYTLTVIYTLRTTV